MGDPLPSLMLASAGLAGCGLVAGALLKAWQNWLDVKRAELAAGRREPAGQAEIAVLKARVRRLEAIASGIEL